jgi:hypothetical protein
LSSVGCLLIPIDPPYFKSNGGGGGSGGGGGGGGSSPAARRRRRRRAARRQRDCGGNGRGSCRHLRAVTLRCRGGDKDTGGNSDGGGTDNNQQSTKSSDGNGGDNDDDENGCGIAVIVWWHGGECMVTTRRRQPAWQGQHWGCAEAALGVLARRRWRRWQQRCDESKSDGGVDTKAWEQPFVVGLHDINLNGHRGCDSSIIPST